MTALGYRVRTWELESPRAWLALWVAVASSALLLADATGLSELPYRWVFVTIVPAALVVGVLRGQGAGGPARLWAAGCSVLVSAAVLLAPVVIDHPALTLLPAVLISSAVLFVHRPVGGVVAVFVMTGTYGSLDAFLGFQSGPIIDWVLIGLWLSSIWIWVLRGRDRAVWVLPGAVAMAVYLLFTISEMITAESFNVALQSVRANGWYVLAFLLIAYAPWAAGSRERMARSIVVVAAGVGAYATFRLIVGASAQEAALAKSATYTNFPDGKLGLVGSLTSRHELGAWLALVVPFCAACALAFRGRLRIVAASACVTGMVGLYGTEVRVALIAVVAGMALVLVLFQLARAFRGLHLGTTGVALIGAAVVGVAAFTLTPAGGDQESRSRFENILTPTDDPAYQARIFKWRTALGDIEHRPLGHGLGTAGRVQQQYARFRNIASMDLDSGYLKIAYEQGMAVMAFFVVAAVLVLLGLAGRAVGTTDPHRAAIAVGACGSLAALLALMAAGVYQEGLIGLTAWVLVGVGAGQFANPPSGGSYGRVALTGESRGSAAGAVSP